MSLTQEQPDRFRTSGYAIVPDMFTRREIYAHDRDPNSDHHIHCTVPEERAIPIELPAGGAVFFNFGMHIAHLQIPHTENARALHCTF